MTSTYEQQAIDFLTTTNTTLTTEFKEFNSMAWDKDGQKRNIFTVTIQNARHKYSFDFGSSLADSLKSTPKIQSDEIVELYSGFKQQSSKESFGFRFTTSYQRLRHVKETKNYLSIIDENELKNAWLDYENRVSLFNKKYKHLATAIISLERTRVVVIDRIKKAIDDAEKQTTLVDRADIIVHPTAYDILACLTKYEVGTFDDFCSNFGYDTDFFPFWIIFII